MILNNILNYQHSIMDISTVHEDEYEHLTVNTEQRDSPSIALWITNITNSHITDIMCMKTSPATWFTTLRITNITDNRTVDISTVYEDEYEDFINTELRDSHRELYKSYELITQTLLTTATLSLWVWRFLHHHQWRPCSVIRGINRLDLQAALSTCVNNTSNIPSHQLWDYRI